MHRRTCTPRPDWQARVESQGLLYHTLGGEPYWDESAYYEFSRAEVDAVEEATYRLDQMCLEAVAAVLAEDRLGLFLIPEACCPWLRRSWEEDEHTIYGRFDLSYDGRSPPKLLEYNADTPTALLEAAVVQWFWLKDTHPEADQFNSTHERLLDAWRALPARGGRRVHFAALADHPEDYLTVTYLRDTAAQAGLETAYLEMGQIGYDRRRRTFVGLAGEPIAALFKLYPWEWLIREEFGPHLPHAPTRWLEPPWKMLLSNKAILAVLWDLFPDSPYLLPAGFEPPGPHYVRKPLLAREGSNVTLVQDGRVIQETGGPYGDGPFVYQAVHTLPDFGGRFPVLGSWLVHGHACGLGIREDDGPITQNRSRFVPHLFVG